jgi:hypothetical protein
VSCKQQREVSGHGSLQGTTLEVSCATEVNYEKPVCRLEEILTVDLVTSLGDQPVQFT